MKNVRRHAIFSVTILLAWCACSFALDPSLHISQYGHTSWKIRDEFVKGVITSLTQTPDGYVWLGTESGLFHFDGVRVVQWEPPGGQQLPGTLITTLLTARDGTLWIGTINGLATWKSGKFSQIPEAAGQITSLLEASDGTVWAGIFADSVGGLCDIRRGLVHCARESETFGTGVRTVYEDSKGTLWLGLSNGIWRWKPGRPEFFSVPNEPFGLISLAEDRRGQLLLGTHAGIRRLTASGIEPYPPSGSPYAWQITRMFRDHNGGLWVGTAEHGLIHVRENEGVDVFSDLDGLSGDYVTRCFEDREGSVWVATFDGLDRFREYAIPTISKKQGLSSTGAWSVLASKDGSVWMSTPSGLNHWEKGQISLLGTHRVNDGKFNGQAAESLFEDSNGRIWVSTAGALGYLNHERFIPIDGLPGGPVYSMTEVPSGHLWVANQRAGLFHLFQERVLQRIPWAALGHEDFARSLVAAPSQRGLWLGFSRSGIAYFANGTVQASYSPEHGLGAGRVTDLRFGTRGALWAATGTGLSRIKDGQVTTLTSKNGLPCDQAIASIEDNDHSTWLYLACGLVRIAQAELDAWLANPGKMVKFEFFDTSEGVRSHAAAGGFHPLMTKSPDGRIWFLPWDGVSIIDPHHLPSNKIPPPVHIEKITADEKTVDISNGMHLPTGVRHLDIDYTALSLVIPEKVGFRVKLEGEDKDWRELVNVRHVEYTNLPPKHYRFRVLACNNSGVWNEEGAALDFVIPPAWYQTNWFRGACIAAFLMMIWGVHELRVRQLAHQFNMRLEERVAERTRIARDLHDTLLQSFQGLLLQLQAVSYQLQPGKTKTALDAAIGDASQAITEGRDTVQGLRASTVEKNDLAVAIRSVGEELASAERNPSSPGFQVFVEGIPRSLHPILRDEVYRVAAEALRNAFKHAQAHQIEVELRYDEKEFKLRVRDDGKGIDREILTSDGRKGHFGLHGMRERAKLAGGELAVWSELDSGTEIELTIPASRAYTRAARRFRWFRNRSEKDTEEKVES